MFTCLLQKIDRWRRRLTYSPSLKHLLGFTPLLELPEQTVSEHQIRFIHPQRI